MLVVVAFEIKTPDLEAKMKAVRAAFEGKFGDLLITMHTVDRRMEIAGGCSNKNYALREAHKYLKSQKRFNNPEVSHTVTTCDTDSLFHPNYFEVLEHMYNFANPDIVAMPKMQVW